ncbi:IS630 family transposase [Oculatella sp. FACHB-28]|uniref:IS630 family transposase n=1 Tax=Oculatella sp. FACHB-28 TaxID=2692845 RepID=UPI001684A54E|nr:IS630 family transposase [Oculatella sp. FACHB-28]MBD2055329.1 IS630 family transposase [Oculatella sp. FACHB-28]
MNKPDARLLNPTTQDYLRQQAIRLREQGKRASEIASYLGVHRTTVSEWWRAYQQEGEAALHQQKRGNRLGEGRTLSPPEEEWIQQLMRKHFPDQLKIDSALWTRSAVQTLIACECGVEMPIRTVGEYLKRWGYTPQKPLKRAYEQNPQVVKAWLETDYPAIEQRAATEAAEIAWGDESGLRSDAQVGRGYAPQGRTPEIGLNTQRVRVNYIASISNQGKVRFMLYTQKLTAQVFILFLERLIAKRERKLIWIVDRHPVHRSDAVRHWLQQHQDKIEMHFLPSYSPQLNPVEYLNCDVKQGVHSKPPTRQLSQLKGRLRSHLFKLQKLPTRIVKYFKHPFIAYAA